MAPAQQKARQAQDPYAQRGKTLTSSVQRLRGWVGTNPSRAPELADGLIELTAHRVLGHGYAAAATDAQEAVRRAAQLLTANGPIGPYTSTGDAVRYLTAVVHLATIQAGMGLPDAAGQTIASLHDMEQRLREFRLDVPLAPRTAIWALSSTARAALASGDVAAANAHADAALARLGESGLRADPDAAYLAIDTDRLASDCRWAAGRGEEALTYLHAAQARYDEVVVGRLSAPAGLSPALVERLAAPLFSLYRDLADRLVATGEVDLGLVTRRALVELLRGLAGRLGDHVRVQLAAALTDLARDLLAADRVEEADAAAAEAAEAAGDRSGVGPTRLLVTAVRARVLTRAGRSGEAVTMLRGAVLAESAAGPSAAHAVALAALAEALRAEGDLTAAEASEREFADLARDLVGPEVAGPAARTTVADLARGVVSRGRQAVTWAPLPAAAAYAASTVGARGVDAVTGEDEQRQETAAWLEAERTTAHQRELERLAQARLEAERREAERVEAERAAAKQLAAARAQAEAEERLATERRAAAEEAERLERKRRREERLEAHRLEVEQREAERREAERLEAERREAERLAANPAEAERLELERLQAELAELERAELERAGESAPAEPDELALAQQAWQDAKARGDRRGGRVLNERVVELLRPRAQRDPAAYGPQLQSALEELSSARLRGGDVWGSRAPAKEAKALAKTLGR